MKIRRNGHYGDSPITCPLRNKIFFLGIEEKIVHRNGDFFSAPKNAQFFIFWRIMKNFLRKISTYLLLAFTFACALCGCFQKKTYVISEVSTQLIITVSSDFMTITEDTTLLDYMQSLQADGQVDFELNNGMIVSINGITNASDWSQCWMLYTSDSENANTVWGTVDYNNNIYGSAIFGAETLKVKDGCVYIWFYQTM